jgi:branched-chain amino acid transport system permease protein
MDEAHIEMTQIRTTPLRMLSALKSNTFLLGFLAVMIIFPFAFGWITGTSPITGPSKFWQGQLINFFILAVYAMSYDLLIGYTGILSFGHAAFFGGGAYAIGIFYKHIVPQSSFLGNDASIAIGSLNLTPAITLVIAVLLVATVSMLLGLLFSAVAIRVKGVYFAMVTLALAEALHILSKATDFSRWTGADEGMHGVPFPAWLNPNTYRLQFYFIALAFLVLMFLVLRRVVQSPTGRVMVAVRENESRVRMIGYNPALYRSVAFMVGGFVAGLAGAMTALWNLGATPSMTGALTTINALIITILGGMGTLVGPIVGAGIMQVISQFFYTWFGARWPLVFGILFIFIVIFLPNGIVGTWRMKEPAVKQGLRRIANLFGTK